MNSNLLICLLVATIINVMTSPSGCQANSHDFKNMSPLMFGRRTSGPLPGLSSLIYGKRVNPNANSLFFGKRTHPGASSSIYGKRTHPGASSSIYGKRIHPGDSSFTFGKRTHPGESSLFFGKRLHPGASSLDYGKRFSDVFLEDPLYTSDLKDQCRKLLELDVQPVVGDEEGK